MSEIRHLPTVVRLRCGDDVTYDPAPYNGDIVWCQFCIDYQEVITGGAIRTWTLLTCEQCPYERKYRLIAEHVIRVRADTHRIKTGHAVHVIDKQGKTSYRTAP
jgi:hypothetical protein